MDAKFDIERLRNGTPAEQSTVLKAALLGTSDKSHTTGLLLSHIKKGSLSPSVVQVWLGVARDPAVTVDVIQQCRGSLAWHYGVKSLARLICHEATFKTTWDLVGGAQGLVRLMSELSLKDVGALCKALKKTACSGRGRSPLRAQRQECLSELLRLLWSTEGNPDQRPLRTVYAHIAPACTPEVAQEWAKKIADYEFEDSEGSVVRGLQQAHADLFQSRALAEVLSNEKSLSLDPLAPFCHKDPELVLVCMQKIVELESLRGLQPSSFLRFVTPYARQIARQRQNLGSFWNLVIDCLRKHADLRSEVLPVQAPWRGTSGLIGLALKAWRQDSSGGCGDEHICALVSFIPRKLCTNMVLAQMVSLVSPSMKYPLIRMFFKHASLYGVDLGEPSSTDNALLSTVTLPTSLLAELPRSEALALFERWLEANPSLQFLHDNGWKDSTLMARRHLDPEYTTYDIHVIRAILIRQARISESAPSADFVSVMNNLRTEEYDRRKREAVKAQDPAARGFYAESALALSIALGDVKLMTETLIWCRRFLRDSLAVRKIFCNHWWCASETRSLVGALDSSLTKTEDVLATVYRANEFLLSFFETGLLALREPSFDPNDWHQPLAMIEQAASDRLAHVDKIQDKLALPDDQVYDLVLRPTLELIIDAESQMLKADNEGLYRQQHCFGDIAVPSSALETTRPPTLRFLDAMAKARDGLWLKARVEENPAACTLEAPWPRGLDLGSLTGDEEQYNVLRVPFVEQHAESVVFCKPESLLAPFPGDEETQTAIGPFIDSWTDALSLWLAQGEIAGDREDRVRRAWAYALDELSRDRMSRDEAERFWRPVFNRASVETRLLGIDQSLDHRLPAELPLPSDSPGQPEEWDPDPSLNGVSRRASKKRILGDATCLDRMLHTTKRARYDTWRTTNALAEDCEVPVVPPPEQPRDFWGLLGPKKASSLAHSYVDAFIAAAVLSLNNAYGAAPELLKAPFPGTPDARFPAVYLDGEFLERAGKNSDGALEMLTRLNRHTPPRLLGMLASSVLDRIESEKSVAQPFYQVFTKVVKLLSRSNDPSLAVPLIARFVLDFPEASAWHRAVLNKGTVSALDHRAAEDFFSSLCDAFAERMMGHRGRSKQPSLKVTTIKMVLDLLGNTRYLGPAASFDVIARKLLRHAEHIDVRTKALTSLLEVYGETPTQEALQLIRTCAVPMAASLNERVRPLTDADWEALESSDSDAPLPEVTVKSEATPVMDLLQSSRFPREHDEIADLAYEAQRLSVGENARWVRLFLKRNGFALRPETADILCSVPKFPWDVQATFICSKDAKVPRDVLRAVGRWTLLCLRPSPDLAAIGEVLKKDPKSPSSNPAIRWLELTEPADDRLFNTLRWAIMTLHRFGAPEYQPDATRDESSVTLGDLEDFVTEQLTALVDKGDMRNFDAIARTIHPAVIHDTGDVVTDSGAGRVLGHLVRYIDSLRTPAWQADPARSPPVLPQTLPLRLKGVVFPYRAPVEGLPAFVDQVLAVLSSLVESGKPYHDAYILLEGKVRSELRRVRVALTAARLLGSVDNLADPEHPSLYEHLRVQLACSLLRPSLKNCGTRHREEAEELLRGWKESSVEEFRDLARDLHLPPIS